jgi:hypothetical protein
MDPAGNVTQVIGIDNDLSLGATHRDITKVRKQYYGLPPIIDRNYAQAILHLQPQMVQEALTGVLGEGELSALLTRIRLVQEHLRTMPPANMKQAGEYDAQTANALDGTDSYFRDFEKNIVRSRYIGAMVRVGIPEPVAIGAASKTILKYKELGLGEAEMTTDIAPIIRAYHRAQPISNTAWFLNNAERTVMNDLPLLRHLQTLPGIGGATWIEDVLPMLSGANITYAQIQGVWASLVTEVQNAPPATADQLRQLILVSLTAQQFAGRDRRRQQAQQPQQNNAPVGRGRFVIGNRNAN